MTGRVVCVAGGLLAVLGTLVIHRTATPVRAAEAAATVSIPERLADTGLFAGDGVTVDPRNRSFSPQYPLWSDGLTKRRWIYLPEGAAIDGRNEREWSFPVGTKFWKEFSLHGRKVETRLLWKTSPAEWTMASYAWNDEGTEAALAPEEGVPRMLEVSAGRRHSIPGRSDCAACHGSRAPRPLGFNALQLSTDRDPNAIHGAPLEAGMVTLQSLVTEGRLTFARGDILANPPRIPTKDPDTRAVLGYLAANCAMCHDGKGEIAAVAPVIRFEDLVRDGDAVARSFAGTETRWQLPGSAEGTMLVHEGKPELSAMVARMRSRAPSSQMPPLGTVLRDQQAVDAITRWIATGRVRAETAPAPAARPPR